MGLPLRVQAGGCDRRDQRWIDDANGVIFVEEGLFISDSRLHVVNTLHVRHVGQDADVSEGAVLS